MERLLVFGIIASLFLASLPAVAAAQNSSSVEKILVIIGFKGKADQALIRGLGGEIKYAYGLINAVAAKLPQKAIEALSRNPNVAYIEEDGQVKVLGETLPWGVDRIDAELVHPYNKGAGVKVAIIDTGIDYTHPDLAANYAGGYDFVNGDSDPMDDEGHGTHVAGTVAAVAGNGIGVIGVAPEVSLYAVKVLDSTGSGNLSDVIAGIEWAVNNGIQVINMSLGTDTDYSPLKDACDAAYSAGVLLVAAAGNDGNPPGKGDTVDYPAAYSSVIAVVATDSSDSRARWSSTGPEVELSAPGVDILSTYLNGTYATGSGTSMAAPHVTGVAALVMASNPGLTNVEVRQLLRNTAEDLGPEGFDWKYGYGLVDADEAAAPPRHDVAVTDISAPSPVVKGDVASIKVTVADLGTYDESFSVDLYDITDNVLIGTQAVSLVAGETAVLAFDWDTTSASLGDHIITAEASVVSGENDTSNNSKSTTVTVVESQPALHVSVSTDRNTYPTNSFVYITVEVTDDAGTPVEGAAVDMTVYYPDGSTARTLSGTTDSNGEVQLKYRVHRKDPKGVYTIQAEAVKSGYTNGIGSTTFSVV